MKRILLVSADQDPEFANWVYHGIPRRFQRKAFMAPLHLATIAALTPPDYEVRIWDEPVHGLIDENTDFGEEYDLVGITAFSNHLRRARRVAQIFRRRGMKVAIGGPGVSATPEECRDDFDVLFCGESEETWPQFLADFQTGKHATFYKAANLPDMSLSPRPRWDSVASHLQSSYLTAGIQVTRGCPFDCEFCSVWETFGRKMRTKAIPQVIEEMIALESLGVDGVLFCSDNFVGNPRYAKELLRAVTPVNNSFDRPLLFYTELDSTISKDDELLALLADANFSGFLIGIETPNRESLKETRKRQNLAGDLVERCRKIQSYGVPIEGSMIVGFDHDTPDVFDMQFEFLQQTCIPLPKVHLLKAIHGTELRRRMLSERRVLDMNALYGSGAGDYLDSAMCTNILPMRMSRTELLMGYLQLVERVSSWNNFEERVKGFVSNVRRQPRVKVEDPHTGITAALRNIVTNFPDSVQGNVRRILAHTERTAPFLLRCVSALTLRQYFDSERLPHIRKEVLRQVNFEESMGTPPILTEPVRQPEMLMTIQQ